MNKFRPLLFLLTTLLLLLPANASQHSNFYFRSLGVEDGLSQNMVYAILQDRQGFMWFGTQNGLNRYDGNSFKVYKRNISDEKGLKSDAIFSLAEDTDGILWIGTDMGVFLYNPVFDSCTNLSMKTEKGLSITGTVRAIVRDKEGNMWLGGSEKGIFCVTPQKKIRFYPLNHYLEKGQGIRSFCFDMDGNLWIATYQQGILKLNISTGETSQILISDMDKNTSGNDVNHLCILDSETLLVSTVSHGLLKLNLRNKEFTELLAKDENGKPLFVRYVCIDKNAHLWIGTENGLYIYSTQTGCVEHFQHIFNDSYSLSDNAIHFIYQDKEGGMWLGTFFGGVNYFAESYARFEKYYPITGSHSISGKSISEFCEDEKGNVWIGTEDGGLNCFNPLNRTFTQGYLSADNIHALLCDKDNLWIGSFSEGLFVLNLKDKRIKNYRSALSEKTLSDDNIYSIYKDYTGIIWVGTMTGLHRYAPETDNFVRVCENNIFSQVNDILEDFDGVLWFATLGQGLFSYDRKQDKWEHYPTVVKTDATRGKMAICLLEDQRHHLWIGTEGAGMIRYDKQSRSFTNHFSMNEGLPNNVIYQLQEDANGYIWGSTNKGLFRLELPMGKVKTYTHADGLLGDQFNYKSGFVSQSGKMYFGGVKGFIVFEADKLESSLMPPNVVFNSFQVDNVEVPVGGENALLECSIAYTQSVTLPHDQSIFSIGFTALNYASPQEMQYAYRLEGWDQEWIYVSQAHQATYSNLPSGEYTFCVKATNSNSTSNETVTCMKIRILPPFYLTVWAYIAYAILIVLIVFYAIRSYITRLQRRSAKAIELLQRKKEKELYNAKINFFTNITHEIRTPLSLIKAPLEEVIKEVKVSDSCYENLSIIQRNTNRLLKLVNELLDFRKAEAKDLQLNFTHTDVVAIIRDTIRRFTPAAKLQNIVFQEYISIERLMVDIDAEMLTKILSNLFSNALKHAASFIKVCLESGTDNFNLTIINDGDHIPPEQTERIFEPFVKLDENSMGTGIGLPLTRTLIEAHKGQIFVDTNNSNVAFVIILPIRQEISITLKEDNKETVKEEQGKPVDTIALPNSEHKNVVLSVEDNQEFQDFMSNQLKENYLVLKAGNGVDALRILGEQNIDLIISDVMMPVMDGMALCKEIKENLRYSHIPIILLTARTDLQTQLDGLKIGADEYITKPYSIDYLKARIENLLENRKKIRESYKYSPESTIEVIAHSKADEDFLNKLVETIHAHLDEVNLDVDALALMMNMSRATLYRKVKSISELTPNDFIRLIRLKKAAELLRNKEYRINEIAFIVGFNSSSYFSKCFYKQFGVLPKDFERSK